MIQILDNSVSFFEEYKKNKRPVVLYGAGANLRRYMDKVPSIDMICDKYRVGEIVEGYEVCDYKKIQNFEESIYVVVTIVDTDIFYSISEELGSISLDITLVHACNNIALAFDYWSTSIAYQVRESNKKLSVNLVCSENDWIFKKFADKMAENLTLENIDVEINTTTKKCFDINHHIPYIAYHPYPGDTLMITHVDTALKLQMLKRQLEIASVGICMSKNTMDMLVKYGISREKVCYINPAHDGIIRPHKYLIGITHKCRDSQDLRKRAGALLDSLEGIDSAYFKFFIMGTGWESIVAELAKKGYEVDYHSEFDYDTYTSMMQQIDYFLFMGNDEGAMGYLDAMAAGAGIIVTPQGYHLDTSCPIDYPCQTVKEFQNAFLDLQNQRKKRVEAVQDWTWSNYAKKHLAIWNYITRREPLEVLYGEQLKYNDGIYSMLLEDNRL